MIKEKNPLINLKLTKKISILNKVYKKASESLYSLFDLILENPIENIWFECLITFLGYTHLIIFIFDTTVSLYK